MDGTLQFLTKAPACSVDKVMAKALYDYTPRDCDEICLEEDDIVYIYRNHEHSGKNGWYLGENNGAVGFFPMAYVELCDERVEEDDPRTVEGAEDFAESNDSMDTLSAR